jgi:hypothetical protein
MQKAALVLSAGIPLSLNAVDAFSRRATTLGRATS